LTDIDNIMPKLEARKAKSDKAAKRRNAKMKRLQERAKLGDRQASIALSKMIKEERGF
jgi:hypothetical protein